MIVAGLELRRIVRTPSSRSARQACVPGVVELGRLADDDRPGADDEDRRRASDRRAVATDGSIDGRLVAPSRPATNRSKTSSASSGPGEPSGWYWTVSIGSSRWRRPSTEPSLRLRWLTRKPDAAGSDSPTTWTSWFWAVTWTPPVLEVLDRVVRAVVAEAQAGRLGAGGAADDLVAEADAEQRPAVVDDRPRQRDRTVEPGRIARARARGPRRRRPGRAPPPPRSCAAGRGPGRRGGAGPDDVRLEPEVDDRDQRAAVPHAPDVHDRRRRDLAHEVLVLPARHRRARGDGRVRVGLAGRGDDAALAAGLAQVAGERAGVDAGDGRDRRVAQERDELARAVEHGGRRVGDDERRAATAARLVVVGQPPVVADERVGHDHDLAGVRGVGADLLVAGLAGVDDEVAAGGDRRPERDAGEDGAVLERQQRRTEGADARIDDGARSGRRRHGSGDHAAPDTTNPPASGARWADACADIDASFAGLTGPVRQPHRTGHERTASG